MHAHTIQAEIRKEKLDEAIKIVREQLLPQLRERDGYQRGYVLLDRESGKAEFIIVWKEGVCFVASELYRSLLEHVRDVLSGTPKHTAYEVVVEDPPSAGHEAASS